MRGLLIGLRAGVPIAVGYVPIAMAFGLLAGESGLTVVESAWMSAVVFAGASQFVGVQMWAAGAAAVHIVLTTFLVNLRHLLMSASLAARLRPPGGAAGERPGPLLPVVAFTLTDETFAVASLAAEGALGWTYLLGLHLMAYGSWVGGTVLGGAAGRLLPEALSASMDVALYAMFTGLLVPALRAMPGRARVPLVAAAANAVLQAAGWSQGWALVAATLAGALVGAVGAPKEAAPDA
ncbi:MAG TPA: AzlC family ABC transporter permease [Dehalococcoidia bacterium]